MSQFEEILDPGDTLDDDDILFKIDNINKSFSYNLISQNLSNSILNSNENPSEKVESRKRVRFTEDTIFYNEHNICLSIIDHEYVKEVGHTMYTIKVNIAYYIFLLLLFFIIIFSYYSKEMNGK